MMKRLFSRALLLLVTLSLPLSATSTPPAIPVWSYRIRGVVLDVDASPLEGIPVALAGTCSMDGLFLLSPGQKSCAYVYPDRGTVSTLTDDGGAFYLDVFARGDFDSLAVAIVTDEGFFTGDVFAISSARHHYDLTESIPRENEGFLCSDSIEYEEKWVGFALAFPPDTLVVGGAGAGLRRGSSASK